MAGTFAEEHGLDAAELEREAMRYLKPTKRIA